MIVKNNATNLIVVPAGLERVTLVPGNNEIADALWLEARVHVTEKIDDGIIEEVGAEITKEGDATKVVGKPFSKLSVKDACAVVKTTYDLVTLNSWKSAEARDSVRAEIINQIELVEKQGQPS